MHIPCSEKLCIVNCTYREREAQSTRYQSSVALYCSSSRMTIIGDFIMHKIQHSITQGSMPYSDDCLFAISMKATLAASSIYMSSMWSVGNTIKIA